MNYTLDTFAITNWGYDLNELDYNKRNTAAKIDSLVGITSKMIIKFPYNLHIKIAKLMAGKELKKCSEAMWDICATLLDGRLENKRNLGENIDDEPTYYSDVLLQLAKRDKLNRYEAARLSTDFLLAGIDTSAVTVSYTLLLTAMFPKHQEAIYTEIVNILGDNPDILPTWKQLSKMTYLERVLKEVMRLYGVLGIMRRVTDDLQLGDYLLPNGSSVYLSFHSLHRDPQYWSHPQEFYPDHFLPEEIASRPKEAYYPFSWGPRSCPAGVYAMIVSKTLLCTLLRVYKFETEMKFEEIKHKYSLFLEVSQGYNVRVINRNT